MRKGPLLAVGASLVVGASIALAPACTQERQAIADPTTGAGNPTGAATDGDGGAGGAGGRGDGGAGGRGGAGGEGGGVGGGPESLPDCACLLDANKTEACGTCLSFSVVDECGDAYSACQSDADCVAVDNCVLEQKCTSSSCLETCRDLGTPEALDRYEAMYACACSVCNDDCDNGDSCR